MKLGILKNEMPDSHSYWEKACLKKNIDYVIIELTKYDWLDHIKKLKCDFFLACPSGTVAYFKEMYDKRLHIINKELGFFIYPSFKEIQLHEDKTFLSYWLKANEIDAPLTEVIYNKKEALKYSEKIALPIVVKSSIGASGSGVKIFHSRTKLKKYIKKAFSKKGILPHVGPNLKMGNLLSRFIKALKKPGHVKNRIKVYSMKRESPQKGFVILQEYISHNFEWRVVKIGDSYFAHKKIKKGDKASGTKGIEYVMPPLSILDFVQNLCESHNISSAAIDIFEHDNRYLVNEIQTIFGHVQDYICEVDGKAGRFKMINNEWKFEQGFFNGNLSYDLRLENALHLFAFQNQ